MLLNSWLTSIQSTMFSKSNAAGKIRKRLARSMHAVAEYLEDRALLSTLYVDQPGDYQINIDPDANGLSNGDTVTWGSGASQVSGLVYGTTAFGTISDAITAAASGDTIYVGAGAYSENLNINKSLSLLGAQSGVDAQSARGSESIVSGVAGQTSFTVAANDVVIDGFTIQNSTDPNLFGAAVYMQPGTSGTQVRDNIIQNNLVGVFVSNSSPTDQTILQQNLFRNNSAPGPADGQDIYADQYTGGTGVQNIKIDNNTFTNDTFMVDAWAIGISNGDPTPFTNLTITNNHISNHGRGMYFYSTDGATISGNVITGVTNYGIGVFDYGDPRTENSHFTIQSNTITTSGSGVGVEADEGGYAGTLTVSSSGVVDLFGTTVNDVGTLSTVGGQLQFSMGGNTIFLNNPTGFNFNGDTGDDQLIVDYSGGPLNFPINYDGGTGGNDSLTIDGGSTTSVTHTFVNANDGSVSITGAITGTINYVGLEPITDNLDAADRSFVFTGAAETIALTDNIVSDGMLQIDSSLGESVDFPNPTSSLTIDTVTGAAVGADSISITSVDSSFNASTLITAKNSDTVNLNAALTLGSLTSAGNFTISNASQVNLNANLNTNAGTNAGAINITGPVRLGANVSLNTDASATDGNITFSSPINDLTAETDTLTLTSGSGNIQLSSVGATTRVKGLAISSATNVSGTTVLVGASGITQTAGTGTTTFTGLLDADTGGAINLTGTSFVLSGGLSTATGAGGISITHTGAGSLDVNTGAVTPGNGGTLTLNETTVGTTGSISSVISGTNAAITKTGAGSLTLTGSSANTFTGLTTLTDGTLVLNKSAGNAISGNVLIGDGTGTDILQLNAANQISDTSDVTVTAGGGTFDLNGHVETIDGLNGGGLVTNGAAGAITLTVGANNDAVAVFGGIIQNGSGTVSLTKNGTGTQTLSGINTYGGTTTINGGRLLITGSTGASGFTVNNTAVLGGTGVIGGSVFVGSGGKITGGDLGTVGTLSVNNLTFIGGTYSADILGSTSDQIVVSGTVDLFNSVQGNFALSTSGTPTDGTVFDLINNTGAAAISHPPFSGIAEGSSTTVGGKTAYYTYSGGAGANDFTLSVAGPATFTSDGLGAGALELRYNGANVQFLDDGVVVDSRPLAALLNQTITVNGSAAQDETLFVNYGAAGGFFDADIVFHGGVSGTDNDALKVSGSSFTTVTNTFTTTGPEHSGNIVYNTATAQQATISYDGLEPVDLSGSTIANLVFNLPGTADQAILEDATGANISQIRSQAAVPTFETTAFATPTGSLTVNLGADNSAFTVDSLDSAFNSGLAINGQAGTDTVNFQGSNNSLGSLNVNVSGDITDSPTTRVVVSGLATFSSGAGNITLGDSALDNTIFGSLTFVSTGAVAISTNSNTNLTGTNTANSLTLTSRFASVTDNPTTSLTVTNNATFATPTAGQSITLGDNAGDTTNFGTLTFVSTGAVSISENSATALTGTNTANSLSLTSETGAITDNATTSLTVTNNAAFVTSGAGQAVTLGDNVGDTTNFGTLTVTSTGAVTISEDSDSVFAGSTTASSLTLNTTGSITDGAAGSLNISGLATFNATTNITLGDSGGNSTNFGSLTFAGTNVDISEDSSTVLAGASTGTLVGLVSAGSITDGSAAPVIITATSLALSSASGVGTGDPIETQVSNFAAAGGTGGVLISNTGGLTMTSVTPSVLPSVTGITGAADSSIQADSTIAINAAVTIGGAADLTLNAESTVSQTAAITATGLQLLTNGTGGAFTLTNVGNNVATIAANTATSINFVDANTLSIGSVAGALATTTGITTSNANVSLRALLGNITINNTINLGVPASGGDLELILNDGTSATVTQGGAANVLAAGLALLGPGAGTYQWTLDNAANNVGIIAADFNAGAAAFALRYQDADDLHVGAVTGLSGTTTGISTGNPANGGGVRLRAGQSNPAGELFVDNNIDTSSGANGNLLIGGGVVTTANLILGSGSIDLAGGANFPDIIVSSNTSITLSGGTATLQPNRDIIVRALLQSINGGLTLNADADNNGVGGVWIDESAAPDAQVLAAGNLLIQGSDVFATGASTDSVRVDDDTTSTANQIVASGSLTIQSKLGTAPAGANIYLDGIAQTSGAGTVAITAQNSVFLTSQVTSTSGNIAITATTGDVSVTDSGLAGAEILANAAATITVTANGTTTLGSNVTVQSAGGDVTFNTNDIAVDTTSASITATATGNVTIRNFTAGRTIDLGTNSAGSLGITDAELDRVTQAAVIRIGRRADGQDSGTITVSAGPINAANVSTLHLISGNNITETGSGFITAPNLAVEATNSILLNTASDTPATPDQNDNDVDTLALRTFSGGSDATFWDADGFVVAAVDGLNGINVNDLTQLSSGVETTLAGSDVTQTAPVLSNGLQLLGQGNFTLDLASNDVTTLAGTATNSITYSDANSVTIGTLTQNAITSVGTSSSSLIVTAPTVVINNAITTTSELGFVILDVTTLLDVNGVIGGGTSVDPIINSAGFVQQTGTGSVELQGKIATTDDNVSFNGPVKIGTTAGSSAVIDTGSSAGGNITFNNTVQGTTASATPTFENLTLNAGTGDILFNNQVGGGGFRLGVLTVQSARQFTTNVGVTAREIKQVAGSGVTTFNGFVQTNQANGIDVTSNYITFNGSIQTTNGGTVKINNASDFQLVPGAGAINADGAVTQTGTGLNLIGGDIATTDDAISFAMDTYISNTSVLLNAGLGNVTFSKLLQVNNKSLTIRDGNTVDLGTRTTIANGTLTAYVGNAPATTPGSLSMTSGALFTGAGTVNATLNVGAGATLAPASATTLLGTGILTVNGNVNLASGSVYTVDLNSATVGTGYDQLVINGAGNTMNITAGAVLQANRSTSFSPAVGTSLKILDGVNNVTGNFTGAANAATLSLNGANFTINYNSPAGDITLTSAAASGSTSKIIDNDGGSTTTDGSLVLTPASAWTANTVAGRGFTNDLRFASGIGGTTPNATATYTFTNLTPGTYRVSATWYATTNRATNSPFTITGGASPLTVTVNQQNSPNGFTADGATWNDLSPSYTITGTTLTVTLGNNANGYVIADAIRIEVPSAAGPEIQVLNGTTDLTSGSSTVDFGTATQGAANVSKTITIKNLGSSPLILGSATLTAPAGFQISGYTPTSLAPGASQAITVTMLTTNAGGFSGTLSIQNNDADENPFSFNISGSVVSNKVWVIDNSPNTGGVDLVIGPSPTTGTYSETGTWSNNTDPSVGFLNDLRFANPGAASTATWSFGGLVTGTYRVSITYRAESNRASNESFTVNGGTSTPVTINEQNAPNDFLSSGVYWEDLVGSYTISGTTLTVIVNAAGSNGYVNADAVRIERLSPLEAAGGPATNPTSDVLSPTDLQQTADAAIARWTATGLDATQQAVLNGLTFQVTNLPGAYLGSETDATIFVDQNAAGYGWYVDQTPLDDSEFAAQTGTADLVATDLNAASHMDLLTVLMHEMGHRLGLDDIAVGDAANSLMTESISVGTRRLPDTAVAVLDPTDSTGDDSSDSTGNSTTDQIFYTFVGGVGSTNPTVPMNYGGIAHKSHHEHQPRQHNGHNPGDLPKVSHHASQGHQKSGQGSSPGVLGRLFGRLFGRGK
ncbi:MAG: Extracellular serine protease precursor [Planctomycetaceae bacterium]|nr:Extracellular serine protease precursor [Planctomycetaceae bacterium]